MKSAQELAALLGVNEATLRLWRAEAGIPAKARNVGYSEDEEARIREIAANKRKSKPRKGDSAPEMPRIVPESQKYAPSSADSPDMYRAFDSAFSATTGTNAAYMEITRMDSTRIDNILTLVLEIAEKLDALTALLERAAIAPRYIARKSVDDALSDLKPANHHTRPMRGNLPPGTQRLSLFAGLHGVPARTARDQAVTSKYTVTTIGTNGTSEYYVEPSQRAGVVAFWSRTGYPYSKCPECPHEKQEPLESL